MMAKYKTRPADVDARQYTGGEENGKELEAWVTSLGGSASYSLANEIDGLRLPEEFHLYWSKIHIQWVFEYGSWLVWDGNFLAIYNNDQFQEKFEKA